VAFLVGYHNIEQNLSRGDGERRRLRAALLQSWHGILRRRCHRQAERAKREANAAKGAARSVSKPETKKHAKPPGRTSIAYPVDWTSQSRRGYVEKLHTGRPAFLTSGEPVCLR
jgi:hypothetical protein